MDFYYFIIGAPVLLNHAEETQSLFLQKMSNSGIAACCGGIIGA